MAAAVAVVDRPIMPGLESRPTEGEFFVHRNSPLALLKQHEATVFGVMLPWLFDSYRTKTLMPVLRDSAWDLSHRVSAEQRQQAINSIESLPFQCFDIGCLRSKPTAKVPTLGDPFDTDSDSGWLRVSQLDLLLAMRLVSEFVDRKRVEQSAGVGSYEGPLSDDALDHPLPIEWTLSRIYHYAPTPPTATDAQYNGPLTLRKLLGMLMDMAFVGPRSDEFHARYVYIENVWLSNYFIVHCPKLGKRYEPFQWQVVLRQGIIYSPRLALLDVMRDLQKRFDDVAMLRAQMGPNGAL